MNTSAGGLAVEEIRRRLRATVVGAQLYVLGEVDSTNRVLAAMARDGAPEGTVVIADAQRAGRGRLGRPWFSPAGVNLYVSALFRPALTLRGLPSFSLIAGLAMIDAVRDIGLAPTSKWPNDVLVDGRKVGGARVECMGRGERVEQVVLGMGVNVNVSLAELEAALGPAARAASSLAVALGRNVDRNALAGCYLGHLDRWARRYREAGGAAVVAAWRERSALSGGQRVEIEAADRSYAGRVVGIDAAGALVVEDADGHRHEILADAIRITD
jgi:BirA family biotin operon repressor/biotin-[acetyl-CoA-carboxylase] ligase